MKIFSLNISEFPNSANLYETLSEAYFHKKCISYLKKYQKVLELEPKNPNAKTMILGLMKS
jgi:hypothetical protein